MRVGIGYDIHRLSEGKPLFLGGVEIPYVKGLVSYTDGDVVIHAIADAILGALAMGDIGAHFPNADPQYKDICSLEILKKVAGMARGKGYFPTNIDVMVIAEEPKIYPFKDKMVKAISVALAVAEDKVSVKATTNEGVGSIGKGEAIAAYAVASLEETMR